MLGQKCFKKTSKSSHSSNFEAWITPLTRYVHAHLITNGRIAGKRFRIKNPVLRLNTSSQFWSPNFSSRRAFPRTTLLGLVFRFCLCFTSSQSADGALNKASAAISRTIFFRLTYLVSFLKKVF